MQNGILAVGDLVSELTWHWAVGHLVLADDICLPVSILISSFLIPFSSDNPSIRQAGKLLPRNDQMIAKRNPDQLPCLDKLPCDIEILTTRLGVT